MSVGLHTRPTRRPINMPGNGLIRSWHTMRRASGVTLNPTLKSSGTTPPTVSQTGTLTRLIDLRVEVNDVTGGTARGQSKFRWSEDAGSTWAETGITTAATYALVHPTRGANGLTLAFANTGPFANDNVYIGKVVQWNDRSLRGNHYENALATDGTNQPKISLSGINGRPALAFQKSSQQYLRIANAGYASGIIGGNDTPITVFTVAQVTGTVGVQHFFWAVTDTTVSTAEISLFAHSDSAWGVSKRGSSGSEVFTTGGTVDNTTPHIFEHEQPGTTVSLRVDGTLVVTAAQDVPSLTVTEAHIGAIRSIANTYGDVLIGEQIVYAGTLSASERGFIRQYLQKAWAL